MKTAELFTLSCDLAAFLGGAKPEQRAALREFGAAFGTAYQVYDDCVDLFGIGSGGRKIARHGFGEGQIDVAAAARVGTRKCK